MRKTIFGGHVALALLVAVSFVGCPMREQTPAKLYVMLSSTDEGAKALKAELPVGDIESLTVTVTGISLVPAVQDGEEQIVFSGSMDVNLLDLSDVSQVLSVAEVAPGTYGQIRLAIENPRLVLKADPQTVVTDIQLTANGQLFVSGDFEIPEGGEQLLVLDFGGIHLVQTGNGKLVLTPQLRADLSVSDANGLVVGPIASVDSETFVVTLDNATTVQVNFAGAQIFLPADTDTPTGTVADLVVGANVEVQGLFAVDGTMTAQTIHIQAVVPPVV